MNADWKEYSLIDVFSVTNGLSKNRKEFGFGYPFLTFKEIFNNFFVPDELVNLANTTEKEQEKCSIERGDVFITRTSETFDELGITCVSLKHYPKATFNGFTKRLRPNNRVEIDPKYSSFYFKSNYFRSQVASLTTMTTRASLNNEMLERLTIVLPPIDKQKNIAKILADCHNKIEINRQINQTLNEMAQAIFKSWFVDFDPVKAKIEAKVNGQDPERAAMCAISGKTVAELDQLEAQGRANAGGAGRGRADPHDQLAQLAATAAIFPDELADTDLGLIPKGWEVRALDEVADYRNGLALQKFRPENEDDFLPVVKIAQLKAGIADSEEKASPNINPSCIIDNGDVVFSWSGSLMVDLWCGGKAALNQHLFKVTSENHPKWFYYFWTKHHLSVFQQIAADKAVTMGHIKRSHLKEALCVVPDVDLNVFPIMNELLSEQIEMRLESFVLAELRDAVLPKLLSGEIEIN